MTTSHTDRFNRIMEAGKPAKKEKPVKIEMKQIEERDNMSFFQRSLCKCFYAGNTVFLPKERLENYVDIRKALIDAGATYKNNTFVFPNDAEPFVMRLMTGEEVNIKKQFQFFATPPKLAKSVVDKICWERNARLGEFSAGQGGLLDLAPKDINLKITCVELMPENCAILTKKGYNPTCADFLSKEWGEQDIIILNPPFAKNQDIDHFMHAYKHLKKGGGQMSCIMSPHWTFASDKKSVAFRKFLDEESATWQEVDAGEFKSSGTNIKTMLIYITK